MANPSSFNINKEDLITSFWAMNAERKDRLSSISYTHFIPQFPVDLTSRRPDPKCHLFPIYECNCDGMDRGSRVRIEEQLVKKVIEVFNKTKLFTLYSLGSGNCYQELSLCVEFAEKDVPIGKIVLVDREYNRGGVEDFAVVTFSKYAKILFPNVEISKYNDESEYFEDIKNSKQPKPDIILGIDFESSRLSGRIETYAKMLETSNQAVLAYHNHKSMFNPRAGVETFVDMIQGQN